MTNQSQLTVTYGNGHGVVTLDPEDGKPTTYSCTEDEAKEIAECMRSDYRSNSPEYKAEMVEVRNWLNRPASEVAEEICTTIRKTAEILMGRDVHAS